MAINKNFVVKNGIEVNTNLIVADTDSNKVGIGTTVPEYTLHVFEGAGIGVTNITVTGISTNLDELNVGVGGTTFTAISNATLGIGGSVGVGTDAPGYLLEVHSPVSSGQTALFVRGDMRVTGDINIDDISIGDLNVSGISTFEGNILIGTGATVGFGSTAFFKDHAKAIFGDGEDLKVYHDGSNSYISDTGSGGLIVGSNSLTIKNAGLNETQAVFTENGAVELYHDNGKRFNTNAIGVEVSGTLQSTGITTLASSGGITTTGGDLYVGGDLYINEDIVLDTNLEILGIATIGSLHVTGISTLGGTVNGPNNNNSVVVGTGLSVHGSATGVAVTLAGAGGITTTGGDFYVGGDLYISEDVVLDTNLNILGIATIGSLNISGASGINTIDSTVQSSSKDTGALVIEGGVGIEKNLFVGGGAEVTGLTTITGVLDANNTTQSSSSTTGAAKFAGGVGIEKQLYVGAGASVGAGLTVKGVLDANNTTQSSSSTTGAAKFAGGMGIAKNLYVGGGAEVTGLTTITGVLDANNTTQSSSTTTGAAQFAGGVGVAKNLYVGGGQVTTGIHTITDLRVGTQLAGQTLVGITTILDEDNMASDSAAALATQQSIKAYVDAQVTASDLDFQGDSGGAQSVDLDSQTFTVAGTANEIETSASGQTLTIGLPNDVTIGQDLTVTRNVSIADSIFHTGDTDTAIRFPAIDTFSVETDAAEALRVDSTQRLLVNKTASTTSNGHSILQVASTSNDRAIAVHNFEDDADGPFISLGKSRGTSINSYTIVQDDDELGNIDFFGADGTDFSTVGARIQAEVDGTPGANDLPGRLIFATTADGENSPTERLRITSGGRLGINTDPGTLLELTGRSGEEAVVTFNREGVQSSNDGVIGQFLFENHTDSVAQIAVLRESAADDAYIQVATQATGGSLSERLRITSAGRILKGVTTARGNFANNASGAEIDHQIEGTSYSSSSLSLIRNSSDANDGAIVLGKTRSASTGGSTVVQAGDHLGDITFAGADGTSLQHGVNIIAEVQSGVGNDDMPTDLIFKTNGGTTDTTERLRIRSDGGIVATGIATFSTTSHLTVPVGTTGQRDTNVANGMIRYNTTLNSYEGYGNGAWGGLGGGTEIDTSVSTTTATNLIGNNFLAASYRSASMRIQITQGSSYQVGKYLLIHDGTTVTIVEESAIATGDMLGSISGAINGDYVQVKVSMNSASSATVTTIIDKITV